MRETDKAVKIISIDYHEARIINPSFLFLVHNNIEFKRMLLELDHLIDYDGILKVVLEDQPYFIGQFGTQTVVLVKTSDMGSSKPFASLNTTTLAISHWQPTYVIMVGVAAGFKKDIKIGDVIIARESIDYQSNKIHELNYINRAYHYYSGTIFKLFDNITKEEFNRGFTDGDYKVRDENGKGILFKIEKGQVLSGDVLVDSGHIKTIY